MVPRFPFAISAAACGINCWVFHLDKGLLFSEERSLLEEVLESTEVLPVESDCFTV